ncbi:MAG: TIGR00266 family protein [Lachnospiraceae bacterium]|nr:TIGR00266 family protein [Lachnospiraceae bacterium]
MEYRILGNTVPVVEAALQPGESLYTQSGGMAWKTEGIEMSTNARGGVLKGLGRMFSGESLFMATYTATRPGVVAFASTVPGSILPLNVSSASGFTIQKGSFLCAQQSVNLEVTFTRKMSSGFFGGEGFILQRLSGRGMAFLEVDGDVVERTLAPGETLYVDTGNVVGFEDTVNFEAEMVRGLENIFFGGEGLFLTKLTGPGKIILQTQNFGDFTGKIFSRMPSRN